MDHKIGKLFTEVPKTENFYQMEYRLILKNIQPWQMYLVPVVLLDQDGHAKWQPWSYFLPNSSQAKPCCLEWSSVSWNQLFWPVLWKSSRFSSVLPADCSECDLLKSKWPRSKSLQLPHRWHHQEQRQRCLLLLCSSFDSFCCCIPRHCLGWSTWIFAGPDLASSCTRRRPGMRWTARRQWDLLSVEISLCLCRKPNIL